MLLAELILKWAGQLKPADAPARRRWSPATPRRRCCWPHDLARLMDDMTTRQVDWTQLDGLVPAELDEYWQLTLEFLKIVRAAVARASSTSRTASSRPSAATS